MRVNVDRPASIFAGSQSKKRLLPPQAANYHESRVEIPKWALSFKGNRAILFLVARRHVTWQIQLWSTFCM